MKRIDYRHTNGFQRNMLKLADEGILVWWAFKGAVEDLIKGKSSHGLIGAIVNVPVETFGYFWGHMLVFYGVAKAGLFIYGLF